MLSIYIRDTEVDFDLDSVARITYVLANLADKIGTDFLSLHLSLVTGRQFSLVKKKSKVKFMHNPNWAKKKRNQLARTRHNCTSV